MTSTLVDWYYQAHFRGCPTSPLSGQLNMSRKKVDVI